MHTQTDYSKAPMSRVHAVTAWKTSETHSQESEGQLDIQQQREEKLPPLSALAAATQRPKSPAAKPSKRP